MMNSLLSKSTLSRKSKHKAFTISCSPASIDRWFNSFWNTKRIYINSTRRGLKRDQPTQLAFLQRIKTSLINSINTSKSMICSRPSVLKTRSSDRLLQVRKENLGQPIGLMRGESWASKADKTNRSSVWASMNLGLWIRRHLIIPLGLWMWTSTQDKVRVEICAIKRHLARASTLSQRR